MCQPSPLGRCSTDAGTAHENAEIKLMVTSTKEREDRSQLKVAYDKLQAIERANPKKPPFGSVEEQELKVARKTFEKAIASWNSSKEKMAKAQDNVLTKRMHLDTTPAGKKALLEDLDAEDRSMRLKLAENVSAWQDQVKGITDNKGNPITSKEGKNSPESYKHFSNLYKNARGNFEHNQALFNEATEKVKAGDAKDFKAYQVVRSRQLQMLMYQDRMNDLSKIIQKRPANMSS